MGMDVDRFVEACREAVGESAPSAAVRELVTRAVAEPATVIEALGEPRRAEARALFVSPELTVLNVVWGPSMILRPHDHRMWAVIGVYTGREDNIFWRRIPAAAGDAIEASGHRIEAAGAKSLGATEVLPLGRDIVHSVANPLRRLTGAIHVYGGDFFARERSEWDPATLEERPYDIEQNMQLFAESNAVWGRRSE